MVLPEILDCLHGVRQSDAGWTALCPAHPDKNPSLSVAEGDDGRILLHCHRGCSFEEILKALGHQKRDLFAGGNGHAHPHPKKRSAPTTPWQDQANPKTIGEGAIARAQEALEDRWRRMLREERMISDKAMEKYRLGVFNRHSGPRLGIPVFDQSGAAVDVRLWLHPELRGDGLWACEAVSGGPDRRGETPARRRRTRCPGGHISWHFGNNSYMW